MTYLQDLGILALASRLKQLSETMMADGIRIYKESSLDFEPRWFPVTYYLKNHGPAPLTTVAKALNRTHPAVVQVVNILSKKGLVVRIKDAADNRINSVGLSEKGRELISRLEPVWNDIHQAAQELLSEYAPHFASDLERIENALKETSNYTRIKRQQLKRDPPDPRIIPFTEKYLCHYREMNLEWLQESVGVSGYDKKILRNPGGEILQKGGQIYILLLKDAAIGTFTLIPLPDGHCELSKFVIIKEYRQLGLGTRMAMAAFEIAKKSGYSSMLLLTHENLKDAVRLYRKTGFRVVPGHPYLKDHTGRCSITMQLILNQ